MATPDFILALRKKIGHDPLWLVGVTAYVEDGAGRVLLGRRADTGEWALVYGINEPGEEPAATVVREVREETGVDVVPTDLVRVKAARELTVYANGDQTQYLDLMFTCRLAEGGCSEPRVADDESLAVGWFSLDELPEPLAASTRERFAALLAWREAGTSRALFSLG
ncbi:NUDIX hydrolase [Olsenella profusa]|uniref:NUDIX domain-containing protein n=1 Tax=Olsenella profusa TaxID=138595 RepID=A0ABS2F046_9ACTN|nr:NUDIX domain-containing protein [Olsenella profusa]MBM6774225.1 NUDIX domain-containing protein [Olsenella profusa]